MSNSITLPLKRPQLPVRTHCETMAQARQWRDDYTQTKAQIDAYGPIDTMMENLGRLTELMQTCDQNPADFNREPGKVVLLDHSPRLYSHADVEASIGDRGLTHLTLEGSDLCFSLQPSGDGQVLIQRTPAHCEGCSWKQETVTTNPGTGTLTYLVEYV